MNGEFAGAQADQFAAERSVAPDQQTFGFQGHGVGDKAPARSQHRARRIEDAGITCAAADEDCVSLGERR